VISHLGLENVAKRLGSSQQSGGCVAQL
jgi:hypothetical protein